MKDMGLAAHSRHTSAEFNGIGRGLPRMESSGDSEAACPGVGVGGSLSLPLPRPASGLA